MRSRVAAVGRGALIGCALAVVGCGDGDATGNGGGSRTATIGVTAVTAGVGERAELEVTLTTDRAAAGLQVDLVADPAVLPEIQGVAVLGRARGLEAAFQELERGHVRLLLFEPDGRATLVAGQGAVLSVDFTVPVSAPSGATPVQLEGARVVDEDGEAFETTTVPGQITVVFAGASATARLPTGAAGVPR